MLDVDRYTVKSNNRQYEEELSHKIYGILSKREDAADLFPDRISQIRLMNLKYVKTHRLYCLVDELRNIIIMGNELPDARYLLDKITTNEAEKLINKIESIIIDREQWITDRLGQ